MAELLLVRHGQAAFGSDNYDQLTDLGVAQSRALGVHFEQVGWSPDFVLSGTLIRHAQTLEAIGLDSSDTHAGFNEYDFHNLLAVRFGGDTPDPVLQDRKTHFNTLRETLFDWQKGGLTDATESWAGFRKRVADATRFATSTQARRVLVVTSGGVIAQSVAEVLMTPTEKMVDLNLQIKNTSLTRFVFSKGRVSLSSFNVTPHFDHAPELLSFS